MSFPHLPMDWKKDFDSCGKRRRSETRAIGSRVVWYLRRKGRICLESSFFNGFWVEGETEDFGLI